MTYTLMVSNKAQMVQSCILHVLYHHSPIGLRLAIGMDVCVATASIVRSSQTDVVIIGSM